MRWLYSFGAEKVDELKALDFDFAVKSLSARIFVRSSQSKGFPGSTSMGTERMGRAGSVVPLFVLFRDGGHAVGYPPDGFAVENFHHGRSSKGFRGSWETGTDRGRRGGYALAAFRSNPRQTLQLSRRRTSMLPLSGPLLWINAAAAVGAAVGDQRCCLHRIRRRR